MSKKRYFTAFLIMVTAALALAVPWHYSMGKEQLSPVDVSDSVLLRGESTGAQGCFPDPDATRYNIQVYLDVSCNILYGQSNIHTINSTGQAINELWFTVYPNAFRTPSSSPAPVSAYYKGFDPGWLELEQLLVNGQETECYLEGVSMQVGLPIDIMPGQDITIDMKWAARIPELAYRFGTKDAVYMLGNFYPVLNVYDNTGWHLAHNSNFGDPFCFHCADYLVQVNIPEAYELVSTGNSLGRYAEDNGRVTYWIEAHQVRDFCLLLIYDYQEVVNSSKGVRVKCYIPRGAGQEQARQMAEQSAEILYYYSCRWGSYPYADFKIALVPMLGFHGMEYSGLIFLRQDMLSAQYDANRRSFILAHEIAHQWWYAMVGNDQLLEPWLDEALANWSAYEYQEDVQGIKGNRTGNAATRLDRRLNDISSGSEYYRIIYDGGEAFWTALEEELGQETIDHVLRRYLADYKYQIASTENLLDTIRKEARQDMDSFFADWFALEKPAK
jgi:hypothetical protein